MTRTSCPVVEVIVEDGRATGVRTADGEQIAVVAASSRTCGYLPLRRPRRLGTPALATEAADGDLRVGSRDSQGRLGPDGPRARCTRPAPGTVHLAPSVDALAVAGAETAAGVVPRHGLVLIGQMATTDPTRAPLGAESAWAYTHVPTQCASSVPEADGHRGIEPGPWSHDSAERMADRVQARVEECAPGFADRITARRVLGPVEREPDENLVGGALNGGTAALQQQTVFPPGARDGAGRDPDQRPLPRVGVSPPGRRSARGLRFQCSTSGAWPTHEYQLAQTCSTGQHLHLTYEPRAVPRWARLVAKARPRPRASDYWRCPRCMIIGDLSAIA